MDHLRYLGFPSWQIEAKTAEEMESISTENGLRRWLRSRHIEGWSGEEVYARLAYHALVSLEKLGSVLNSVAL